MGREVRRVPADWVHPRDGLGRHIPMRDGDNLTACREWQKGAVLWACGAHPSRRDDDCEFYWDYYGAPPPEYGERGCYMFERPRNDLTHYMLYETTSEGTPCRDCPVFDSLDLLCKWAAENATTFADYTATEEEWRRLLGLGFVGHTEGNVMFC